MVLLESRSRKRDDDWWGFHASAEWMVYVQKPSKFKNATYYFIMLSEYTDLNIGLGRFCIAMPGA